MAREKVQKDRYRICPSCGNFLHIEEKHLFCTVCGYKLIEACPQCREVILYPTARYWPVCGESYRVK